MTTSESENLHDLLAHQRQREEQRWRCPNCRTELSSYVDKCSYCSALIHPVEHLANSEDLQAIERLIDAEHESPSAQTHCPNCNMLLDSHACKCPNCGAPAGGINTESETLRYQASFKLPLAILWLLLGAALGYAIWKYF